MGDSADGPPNCEPERRARVEVTNMARSRFGRQGRSGPQTLPVVPKAPLQDQEVKDKEHRAPPCCPSHSLCGARVAARWAHDRSSLWLSYTEEGFDLLLRCSASQPPLTAPTSIHAAEEPRRAAIRAASAMRTSPTIESATGNHMMFLSSWGTERARPPQDVIGSSPSANRKGRACKETWHKTGLGDGCYPAAMDGLAGTCAGLRDSGA